MNITLIGMPGVGKSSIGQKLAKKLGYKFIDIDNMIEKKFNLKLQKILDKFGGDGFIKIEENAVLEIGNSDKRIISPGGSIIYSKKAMDFLKSISFIVFLDDSFENIKNRLKDAETRGIVKLKNKTLKSIYAERLPLYKKYADIITEMPSRFSTGLVMKNIVNKLQNKETFK